MKPTIGRIVHYVQAKASIFQPSVGPTVTVHLPAIITAVWSDTCVNLQVFTDGTNSDEPNVSKNKWLPSVNLDESGTELKTWHWPERD